MEIILVTTSILFITLLTWTLNKVLLSQICSICVGVSVTWFWMFAGISLDLLPSTGYLLPTAILMGGSVVGIAYTLEKYITQNLSPLQFKTFFIAAGFAAVYFLISSSWIRFGAATLSMAVVAVFSLTKRRGVHNENQRVKDIQDKMKNCC